MAPKNTNNKTTDTDQGPSTQEAADQPAEQTQQSNEPKRYRVRLSNEFRYTTTSGRHIRGGIEIPSSDTGVVTELDESQLAAMNDDPYVIVEETQDES